MLGKTWSRHNQQQMQTPLLVPDKVPYVEKITATKTWWSFSLFLKKTTDLNRLAFHVCIRKHSLCKPLFPALPSSPNKPLKSKKETYGTLYRLQQLIPSWSSHQLWKICVSKAPTVLKKTLYCDNLFTHWIQLADLFFILHTEWIFTLRWI